MVKALAKYDDTDYEHPSLDKTGRFPLDALLRSFGYEIFGRDGKREAVWRNKITREYFLQSRALALIPDSKVQDAIYEQELKACGLD